ncbi:MAG: hypothetical protein M5U26_05045 [Planctomycetota bacterium]|nr:hypothetical protein [Planctomycetota bacterium]
MKVLDDARLGGRGERAGAAEGLREAFAGLPAIPGDAGVHLERDFGQLLVAALDGSSLRHACIFARRGGLGKRQTLRRSSLQADRETLSTILKKDALWCTCLAGARKKIQARYGCGIQSPGSCL